MIATAVSSVSSNIWAIIRIIKVLVERSEPEDLINVINRWPAIILAVSRIAKVPGRIVFLIVSIITKKGNKGVGALWGTRWANIWIVFLSQPNIINLIHKGNLRDKVNLIWLVQVKI